MFSKLLAALPIQCLVCERFTKNARDIRGICQTCVAKHVHAPRFPTPQYLGVCIAAVTFDTPWDALIARYKFAPEPGLARPLADVMCTNPEVVRLLEAADWVIPLPLTSQRLQERGFNQSHWLAKQMLKRLDMMHKLKDDVLTRVRHTAPQRGLDIAQRQRNVAGAFALSKPHMHLANKRVLLLDDVTTTGATLSAASKPLVDAGALVNAVALAWTPHNRENA